MTFVREPRIASNTGAGWRDVYFGFSMSESNPRNNSCPRRTGRARSAAPQRSPGAAERKGWAYAFFRNGSPVRLFTLTVYFAGLSEGRPDFGFLLLKK